MQLKHQSDIIEITVYHKMVKKELFDKNIVYNNKKRVVYCVDFFVNLQNLEELKPNAILNYCKEK